ncbi:hypothetical protein CONCODRAFT_80700, partial [Conidiobolus coronatus NRRL 28638]
MKFTFITLAITSVLCLDKKTLTYVCQSTKSINTCNGRLANALPGLDCTVTRVKSDCVWNSRPPTCAKIVEAYGNLCEGLDLCDYRKKVICWPSDPTAKTL